MKTNIKLGSKVRILDIKITQFSQFNITTNFDVSRSPLVEYQTNLNYRVIENEEKVVCLLDVKIKLIETNEYFAELKSEILFHVTPINNVVRNFNDNQEINTQLLHDITSFSISTIRGVLFEKLKGSVIQNEIYPLIDISKLFPNTNSID